MSFSSFPENSYNHLPKFIQVVIYKYLWLVLTNFDNKSQQMGLRVLTEGEKKIHLEKNTAYLCPCTLEV